MINSILLLSLAFQSPSFPNVLPTCPTGTDPFIVLESRMESTYVSYTKSFREYPRQQIQEWDESINDWRYSSVVGQEVVSETWVNRQDPSVIDVEWTMKIINRVHSPWTFRQFDYLLEIPTCPMPGSVVRGNVHWDWIDASEWYQNYAPEEDREQYLRPENSYLFNSIDGFVGKWSQTGSYERISYRTDEPNWALNNGGSNLFFTCRRVIGSIYDTTSTATKHPWNPPRGERDIEWNDQLWRQRFPVEENAIIYLGDPPLDSDPYKAFSMRVSFQLGGASFIRFDANGNAIDPKQIEWLPNILILRAHARFKMLDPFYPDDGCPFSYSIPVDEEPDYSDDEIILEEN